MPHDLFRKEVEALLEKLPPRSLHALLLTEVDRFSPEQKQAFLQKLRALVLEEGSGTHNPEENLLAEIDAFVGRLAEGAYFSEWSWEEEGQAVGDESWAEEMDAFLQKAARVFQDGQNTLAVACYARLLKAFLLDREGEVFCGPRPPQEMIKSDLTLAKARYLRARYETSPLPDRAEVLFEEMADLAHVGSWRVFLRHLAEARSTPLPDLALFLPHWIERLRAQPREGQNRFYPKEDLRRELLREAVMLKDGVAGLAALAREEGAWHPEVYSAWIDALLQQGDRAGALMVAREGSSRIEDPHERARIAEKLAVFAAETGDRAVVVEAYHRAFHAAPTLPRLLRLLSTAGKDHLALEELVTRELEGVKDQKVSLPESLAARLELLRGDYRAAQRRLAEASPLGWSRAAHPGRVVFPALLLAGSGRAWVPPGSSIAQLFAVMDQPEEEGLPPEEIIRPSQTAQGYTEYLLAALARHPVSSAEGRELLGAAARAAEKRVRAIVSNKHRRVYERAAVTLVACAEAYHLAVLPADGLALVSSLRDEFRRHSAFREALERALNASPLLLPMLAGLPGLG